METLKHYEKKSLLRQGHGYKVFQARENSLGTFCLIHEITKNRTFSDEDQQRAHASLVNYGRLRHPRLPVLSDAWFSETGVYAVEIIPEAKPLELIGHNPLRERTAQLGVFLERTLGLLSYMHANNVAHGSLDENDYAIGPQGNVYLMRTGLDETIARGIHTSTSAFVLSSNIYSQDIGNWAYWMLCLALGLELFDESWDDDWGEPEINRCREQMRTVIEDAQVQEFLLRCLRAKTMDFESGFSTATEAHEFWIKQGLRTRLS